MGFLSGVLGAVKDDESVKTYYPNMETTLEKIKQNMYNPNGLSAAVTAVSEALGEWDGELGRRTSEVKQQFNNLTVFNMFHLADKLSALSGCQPDEVSDHLTKCFAEAAKLQQSFQNAVMKSKSLDDGLQKQIAISVRKIEVQIEKFVAASNNKELRALVGKAKVELSDVRDTVNGYADLRVNKMANQINSEFEKQIRKPIDYVNTMLEEVQSSLKTWIEKAELAVDKAKQKCEEIVQKLKGSGVTNTERAEITKAVAALQSKADNLRMTYDEAKKKVEEAKREAVATLRSLDGLIQKDLAELKTKFMKPIEDYFNLVDKAIRNVSTGNANSAVFVIGDFMDGLEGDRGEAAELRKWVNSQRSGELPNALEMLTEYYGFGRIRNFCKEFLNVRDAEGKTFFGRIGAEIKGKVGSEVAQYENNVGTKMTNYKGKPGVEGKDGTGKEGLNKQLNNIDVPELIVTTSEEDKKKYGIDNGDIAQEIQKLHQAITTAIEAFTGAVKDLVKGDANNDVHDYLEDLKKMLQEGDTVKLSADGLDADASVKGLKQIKADIENILTGASNDNSLQKILQKAGSFYTTVISVEAQNAIGEIKNYVNGEVADSISALQKKAQEDYYRKLSGLLKAMKYKAAGYIASMHDIIDKDLASGVKGLLRNVMGYGLPMDKVILESLKTPSSIATLYHPTYRLLSALLSYTKSDLTKIDPKFTQLERFAKPLQMPFSILADVGHFSSAFANTISTLSSASSALDPQALPDAGRPVLRALKDGMMGFVEELGKAYISKYSMETFKNVLITTEDKKVSLTEYGKKCAKVCLSIVPIVTNSLNDLKDSLKKEDGKWKNYRIYNKDASNHSLHRLFFNDNGYDLGLRGDAAHGELNHKSEITGQTIYEKLTDATYHLFKSASTPIADDSESDESESELKVDFVQEHGILEDLFYYLKQYFAVCHLGAPSKKHPCSVNEMLCWLTGLPHNGVYEKLKGHIPKLFEVPDKIDPTEKIVKPIAASPSDINDTSVVTTIKEICETAYALLTTFVGTGDEATYYACELPNNTLGLQYPSNPADCLDTLLDILRRIFPPLKFLFMQCGQPASENGWLKCEYGKNVASSKWPCKEHSKSKSRCEPKCQPTCGPKCQPNCQPTSPLQSYLSDSLTGHLPHSITSIGCKAECNTCPKGKPGMPCITPLGFRGFSGSTKTGSYLSSVIGDFLEITNINTLFCLSPKTPKTLPEHFDFVSCLVRGWHDGKALYKVGVQNVFEDSAKNLSIQLCEKPNELTDALRDAYGSESSNHRNCEHHHLLHLTSFNACMSQDKHCAPYMSSLCGELYKCLPFKNSNTYLSWAIYLPWTFWDLLNNLYNAFCSINCQDWGCRGCLRGDKCKKGEHGVVDAEKPYANCQCRSIVDCKGVTPTLYQYGFVFGEASTLNGESPKTCSDFCSQLKKVLESKYFENLFKECDNFLYCIRFPFMTLTLALWLLSLLYLLHIMVIRLDLLHIKSHLHSPSSHRIAAQSLLAAARVNKLNRVFYLQP